MINAQDFLNDQNFSSQNSWDDFSLEENNSKGSSYTLYEDESYSAVVFQSPLDSQAKTFKFELSDDETQFPTDWANPSGGNILDVQSSDDAAGF